MHKSEVCKDKTNKAKQNKKQWLSLSIRGVEMGAIMTLAVATRPPPFLPFIPFSNVVKELLLPKNMQLLSISQN